MTPAWITLSSTTEGTEHTEQNRPFFWVNSAIAVERPSEG